MSGATLLVAAGWSAGVALGAAAPLPVTLLVVAAVVAAAGAMLAPAGRIRLAGLVGVAVLAGMARGLPAGEADVDRALEAIRGPALVTGRVADAPVPRGRRVELLLDVERVGAVDGDAAPLLFDGARPRVLVRASVAPAGVGDRVRLLGQLGRPRSRPGWPLEEILARRGVFWVVDSGPVRVVGAAPPSVLGGLLAVRTTLEANTRAVLPEPQASLVGGMVFGARVGLPPELRAALTATGTSHLTAVSGFNIAILAGVVMAIATRLLGRAAAAPVGLAAIWLYTLMVGAPPSALRAATMASFVVVAQAFGRLPDPVVALTLAVALLLGWDPGLAHDVGFQLSVTATAGLVLLSPRIEAGLAMIPGWLRGPVALTLAAEVATLPIVLATFQTISLVAIPANVLVTPLVPAIMFAGAGLAALAPLPGADVLVGWPVWLLASALLWIVETLAQAPGAVLFTGRPPTWLPLAWYAVVVLWIASGSADAARLGARPALLRAGALAGAALTAVASVAGPAAGSAATRIVLLDVEPGAAFVRTSSGATAILATGSAGAGLAAAAAQQLGLWDGAVDLVVAPDHGIVATGSGRRVQAAALLTALDPADTDDPAAGPADDAGAPATGLAPGATIDLGGGTRIEVVDVRRERDRPVLDLAVVADDVAVWLPGAGTPSHRWAALGSDGVTVARLPSSPVSFARAAPPRRWLALVAGARTADIREAARVPVLDMATYGAIELTMHGGTLDVQADRCPGGRACRIELVAPGTAGLVTGGGSGDAADGAPLQSEQPD